MLQKYFRYINNVTCHLVFISILFPTLCFADIIKLKSGLEIEGKIKEVGDKDIKLNCNDIIKTYLLEEISSVNGIPKENALKIWKLCSEGDYLYDHALSDSKPEYLEQALKNYNSAILMDSLGALKMHEGIALKIGSIYLYQKKYDEALGWFQAALKKNPEIHDAAILYCIGVANLNSLEGDYSEANKFFVKSLQINPNLIENYFGLFMIAYEKGDKITAEKYSKNISTSGRADLINSIQQAKDLMDVSNTLEKNPYDRESLYKAAEINEKSGEYAQAVNFYYRILEAYPEDKLSKDKVSAFNEKHLGFIIQKLNKALADYNFLIKDKILNHFLVYSDLGQQEYPKVKQSMNFYIGIMQDFFSVKTLDNDVKIYLFKNTMDYVKFVVPVLGSENLSLYGFTMQDLHSIFVNLELGSGTLYHELAHIMIDKTYGITPSWIDEGLASLFEAPGYRRDGNRYVLVGLKNWRLKNLKQYLNKHPNFEIEKILKFSMIPNEEQEPLITSAGRYILFYLQKKNLLKQFLSDYKEHKRIDYFGVDSLSKVTGKPISEFYQDWRNWILNLSE